LPKHEIDAYLKNSSSKKTSGELWAAYEIAADPRKWLAERDAAAKAEAKKHSTPADDEDELAEEDEEEEETAKSGGKRKRIAAETKTTKEKPASKKAKTDKAPPKKVSSTSAGIDSPRMSLSGLAVRRMYTDSVCFGTFFTLVSCLAHCNSSIISPRRARMPLTRRHLLLRKPPTPKPPRTARRHLRLPGRRLLLLPQRKRPRRPKRPRKMPEMVRAMKPGLL
jgi:hypothetical protein